MPREIEFIFDEATGKSTAETKGYKGTDCDKALDKFKLGEVTDEEKSGEYYEPPAERADVIKQKH